MIKNLFKDKTTKASGKAISFINQKGGVGKTTMAFNCAHALNRASKKVLCIDMDPQANLGILFGVDTSENDDYHIHHLLINSIRELKALHTPTILDDVIFRTDSGIDLIPSGQELSGFELSVAGISAPRQLILKKFINKNRLLERYDYIIFDCPPTLGLGVVNILCASDGVLVPFRPDEFSRKGLTHFNEVLLDIEDMGIVQTPKILAHIPNLMDNRRKQEEKDLQLISNEIEDGRMLSPFYNRAQLVKGQAQRKSVYDFQSAQYAPLQGQFNEMADLIEKWSTNQ